MISFYGLSWHLVVDGDLDLLLRGGNDLVFSLALEVWELIDGFFDDGERLVDLLLSNDQGRGEANDVLVGWFGLDYYKFASDDKTEVLTRRPFAFINMHRSQAE